MSNPSLGYLSAAPRVSTDPEADLGGARAHILGLLSAFTTAGWEVHQFIAGDLAPRMWTRQQHHHSHPVKVVFTDLVRILAGFLLPHIAYRTLSKHLDWVYERSAVFQSLGWIFQRHGTQWILETNSLHYYEAYVERKSIRLTLIAKAMERWAYRRCDVLICVTQALKDLVIQELGIDPDKILVLPNAVDPQYYDPQCHQPKRLNSDFTIGFVGTLYPWQGVDLLLNAVAALRSTGIDITAVIIGDGAMRREWEQLTIELGITDHVRFVGQVSQPEIPAYIAGFDVGYSGHTRMRRGVMYNSPLKIYEYMAMQIPVIASRFADAEAIIRENETGFLIKEGDTASLISAIQSAYDARARLPSMGMAARNDILEHHTWDHRVKILIDFVERIHSFNHG